jgi:tetratricopeptide (TPR) repeat protein
MAYDAQRFFCDKPIVARSPSLAYRASKFAKRNRLAVVTSALVRVALMMAFVITSWVAIRDRRLLVRIREAHYQEAVAAALSGDAKKAQKALTLLEEAGASRYKVAVVRGTVAYSKGDYLQAVEYGEEALKAADREGLPNDVAARALRAAASIYAGMGDQFFSDHQKLCNQEPITDVERLLIAITFMLNEPDYSLQVIEETPSVQHSALGILIRGMAHAQRAMDRRDMKLHERSIRDLEYATFLFRDSPATLAWYATAIAEYIEVSKQIGEQKDVQDYVESGKNAIDKLTATKESVHGEFARWLFYRATGQSDLASAVVRRMGSTPGVAYFFTASSYIGRPDTVAAAQEFEQCIPKEYLKSRWVRISLAFLAPDLPNGQQRFDELTESILEEPPGIFWRFALSAMCLMKTPEEIRELAKSGGPAFLGGNDDGGIWIGCMCHRLLAGLESEADVLKKAQGRQFALSNAHFTIAMLRLADGQREEALHHFKLCKDTALVGTPDYELGRAFYERMQANPDWMPTRLIERRRADVHGAE